LLLNGTAAQYCVGNFFSDAIISSPNRNLEQSQQIAVSDMDRFSGYQRYDMDEGLFAVFGRAINRYIWEPKQLPIVKTRLLHQSGHHHIPRSQIILPRTKV
jgi:hypothetical protein